VGTAIQPRGTQRGGRVVKRSRFGIGQNNRPTVDAEAFSHRPSDAAGAAGDDRFFARLLFHAVIVHRVRYAARSSYEAGSRVGREDMRVVEHASAPGRRPLDRSAE
jgi:hypothetical protein